MFEKNNSIVGYVLAPEAMVGVNKKLMLHAETFLSDRKKGNFSFNGAAAYGKYRFYSIDEVHSHFRLAAYGKISSIDLPVTQQAIDLNGSNSGIETGVIATKLVNKFAFSSSASWLHAWDNTGGNKFIADADRNAIGVSLSFGKLLLPKNYVSYKQVNLNGMLEILGQYNPGLKKGYTDVAPSLQLIFNSVARADFAYRVQLGGSLQRNADNTGLIRFEYNFFNLFSR